MRIEILPKDIHHGQRDDSYRCPVARAVRRCLGVNFAAVDVGHVTFGNIPRGIPPEEAHWENIENLKEVDLPEPVWEIVQKYDDHSTMYPFGFEL